MVPAYGGASFRRRIDGYERDNGYRGDGPPAAARMKKLPAAAIVAAMVCAAAFDAAAQVFPAKPIRLLIPASPGGGTDAIARVLAEALTASLKQPVVAENKPGASGIIASAMVVRSSPDGYTLMIMQNGHTVNPALFKKLPYDTFNDFTPVAPLARAPLVLVSDAASGVKLLKELTELVKRNGSALSFGSAEASTRPARGI